MVAKDGVRTDLQKCSESFLNGFSNCGAETHSFSEVLHPVCGVWGLGEWRSGDCRKKWKFGLRAFQLAEFGLERG